MAQVWIAIIPLLLFASSDLKAQPPISQSRAYDEIFGPTGELRPGYTPQIIEPSEELQNALLRNPLGDHIQIHPVPLLLSNQDAHLMISGGAQRALALQAYFANLILGDMSALHVPELPSPQLFERILKEANEGSLSQLRRLWRNHTPDDIHFLHGPDILRAPSGDLWVVEDNVGYVGGFGDLGNIHQAYSQHAPDVGKPRAQKILEQRNAILHNFFIHAVDRDERERSGAVIHLGGRRVKHFWDYYRRTQGIPNDNEDARITEGFAQSLAETAKSGSLSSRQIVNWMNGFFLPFLLFPETYVSSDIRSEQRDDLKSFSESYCAYIDATSVNEGCDFKLADAEQKWLLSQFENNGVQLFYSPGTAFLGHKALLPYVESMIRYFLKEEPLLRTAPTRILPDNRNGRTLEQDMRNLWRATRHSTNHPQVIKMGEGRQGEEVFILSELTPTQRERVFHKIASLQRTASGRHKAAPLVVAQDYFIPSRMGEFAIDFRPIGFASGFGRISEYSVPWGRATRVEKGKQTKTNVSQGARELVIFREITPEMSESEHDDAALYTGENSNTCATMLEAAESNPSTESASQSSATHPFPQK